MRIARHHPFALVLARALGSAAILLLIFSATERAEGATLTVNSAADTGDALCEPLPGNCTLRDALTVANANDTINFAISAATEPGCNAGTGVCVITPTLQLPLIFDANLTINGYSQPGASENTLAVGSDAAIKIEIDMSLVPNVSGLRVQASNVAIRGLAIGHTVSGDAISLEPGSSNSVIRGNFLGLDAAGTTATGDGQGAGVSMDSTTSGHTIGGPDPADRNVTGGMQEGILFQGADNSSATNNYVGTNAAGTAALGNGTGIAVWNDATNNYVTGNLVSGNSQGIYVYESDQTRIGGNIVGLNASGTAALGNENVGLRVAGDVDGADATVIGGFSAGERNVVSGQSEGDGIDVTRASNTAIFNNYVGTDITGTTAIGNEFGINLDENTNVTVGAGQYGLRNVISGNNVGVLVSRESGQVLVQRNYIGTAADGNSALPNANMGVFVTNDSPDPATNITIKLNVISGNTGPGVALVGEDRNTRVVGNFIGMNRQMDVQIPNGDNGIIAQADGATIGGTTGGDGNTIAFNVGDGVRVPVLYEPFPREATALPQGGPVPVPFSGNVTILRNSIFNNTELGIDIGPNNQETIDLEDPDVGPNGLQNAPHLTGAEAGSTKVTGALDSTPDRDFRFEMFSTSTCDGSGFGEGRTYAGSVILHTDGAGSIDFLIESPATAPVGDKITATVTDLVTGATSEFSNCVPVTTPASSTPTPIGQTPSPTPINVETPGPSVVITDEPTPTPSPVPTATPTEAPTETGGPSGTATAGTTVTPGTQTPVPTADGVLRQGDIECSGAVSGRDGLWLFLSLVDGEEPGFQPCPDIGHSVGSGVWGDVDCDGDIDAGDAMAILLWLADLPYDHEESCTEIGEAFTT